VPIQSTSIDFSSGGLKRFLQLHYSHQAAVKFSHARRDQMLPTISVAATVAIDLYRIRL
jgi:hypothetical protein